MVNVPPNTSIETVNIDASLVHQLIATQFPQWADLAIQPVESSGGFFAGRYGISQHTLITL